MGFFKNKKGCVISDYFMLLCDVGTLKAQNATEVSLWPDHLELSAPMAKQPITLDYKQITDVFYGIETELTQRPKSVIGRAAAGGMLFGGVGMIVGAISGTGTIEKKTHKLLFTISYIASSGETGFLQFEDTRRYKGAKVAKTLKELCDIKDNEVTAL